MKNNITIQEVNQVIDWIKQYFEKHTFLKGAVIGMSGGKDSLIVAKLLCEAIGKNKVFGVIMPNKEMSDIQDAIDTCLLLGIDFEKLNIHNVYEKMETQISEILSKKDITTNSVTTQNLPPRIRMNFLYGLAASMGMLVANTSNLSEIMVGYSTKWGDSVGDFAPLANFTKTEVCQMGLLLGLPAYLVEKVPADGLTGKSDEDNLGITYDELDTFIRFGIKGDNFEKIKNLHNKNLHKINPMLKFETNKPNFFNKN